MKPEKTFRLGAVSCSIFLNVIKTKKDKKLISLPSLSLSVYYRDKEGKPGYTSSLKPRHLPDAIKVLKEAEEYLAEKDVKGK